MPAKNYLYISYPDGSLLASAASANGAWRDIHELDVPFSVLFSGFAATGDTAQLWMSNSVTEPASGNPVAGDRSAQYGSDITTDTIVEVTAPYRWLRARKSGAAGSPETTYVDIAGRVTNNAL
jgi:hypothetical protein